MKKIIQICSLSLVLIFGAVAADAQARFGTDIEIPFAFNVGDRAYDAGNYIVRLEKFTAGSAALSIVNTRTDEVQTVLLNPKGDEPGAEIRLIFDTIEGRRYLTKVNTPDRIYALAKSKAEKNAEKSRNADKPAEAGGIAN